MRVWRKKPDVTPSGRGVSRAAVAGASREELLEEALNILRNGVGVDRAGVWVDLDERLSGETMGSAKFRGLVWDRGNAETPAEWVHLSAEAPLPEELLLGGKSVEMSLEVLSGQLIIGSLVGLKRALWVPIERKGLLHGLILGGSRRKQGALPRELLESVAAEIALAIEFADEQRIARERHVDVGASRRIVEALNGNAPPDEILADIAKSCTETDPHDGPGSVFAMIGWVLEQPRLPGGLDEVEFRWKSGDSAWTSAAESEPLASVWRRALGARRVIGSEAQVSWSHGEVARIVALPLEAEGEMLGVLVAGLARSAASLARLERLDLRAALASAVLLRRKRSEIEARQAAWHRALLESSSEATVLLDGKGGIAALSRGAREFLGEAHGVETAQGGESFAELFRARDQERIETWFRRTMACASEGRLNLESLQEAELRTGLRVRARIAGPAYGGSTAILLESLRARGAAPAAERAETELHNVLEWLEEGVVLFDAQENVRAMNTRFEQIAGFTPDESGKIRTLEGLIARLGEQAAEPERFAEKWRELARGLEGGVREELQMVRPTTRVLERAARPVLDEVGCRLGRVEIYRDLTAQRVFQAKLLQTEKLAALGQMVTSVAHELSNPLTSILGYSQRLLVRQDAAGRTEEVRRIFQEAERASTILRQLLLNVRETPHERRLVALNQVVLRAVELQRYSLAAEKIRVEPDLDLVLPFVQGDAGQLQQVLMNLLGNARQAIEQRGKGGTIRLRTKRISERRVLLQVEDDGPGIPPTIMARIFDPFFTTKPAGVGTGLGLSIVLGIVRQHGGQVHALSPPDGGAVFSIELPAVTAKEREKEAPLASNADRVDGREAIQITMWEDSPDSRAVPPGGGTGGHVLVVEDEPTVARLIADVLEDEGFQVDVLLDGREALGRAAGQPYDLVICDMKMPGLDGQHFYETLDRAGNPLRERFLFVTGDVVAPHTHTFLERNHLPHVAKPFRVEELTEMVHGLLARKVVQEASAAAARKKAARNG
jgi:signal transduction histidine kinase/CheY-like chemotaxis protein